MIDIAGKTVIISGSWGKFWLSANSFKFKPCKVSCTAGTLWLNTNYDMKTYGRLLLLFNLQLSSEVSISNSKGRELVRFIRCSFKKMPVLDKAVFDCGGYKGEGIWSKSWLIRS